MESEQGSRAVRVEGKSNRTSLLGMRDCPLREPGAMRSWGTDPHGAQQQNCKTSMFLVSELVLDDKTRQQMTKSGLNASYSRFWK